MSGHDRTRTPTHTFSPGAKIIFASLALTLTSPALAYVGPGAGITLIGALWGLIMAVVAALSFIVLWPIRRSLKRRRMAREGHPQMDEQDDEAAPSPQRNQRHPER